MGTVKWGQTLGEMGTPNCRDRPRTVVGTDPELLNLKKAIDPPTPQTPIHPISKRTTEKTILARIFILLLHLHLFSPPSLPPFHPSVGDDETFDAEGNVAEKPKERHLEIMEALDVRDRVDPLRKGVEIPHLPDEATDERRDRETDDP